MTDLTTKIQWTDFTINFWIGCFKVDEECKNCYMYRDLAKYGKDPRAIREVSDSTINKKLKAARALVEHRKAIGDPTPVKIFLSSWTDVFLKEADQFRARMWRIVQMNPDIVFQILTKRPELIPNRLPFDWGNGYKNVWLGTSVGQEESKQRIEDLLKVPAHLHFLSAEPLLSYLELTPFLTPRYRKLSWVIVGGESGNEIGKHQYRECKTLWIHDIILQCKAAGVPCFVKQVGTYLSKRLRLKDRHGGDITEWPERLRVREMPEVEGRLLSKEVHHG